jgi:hypothetical protein
MRQPVRQGDVLLIPVDTIPDGATRARRSKTIRLAEGEVTGHHHVLEALDAKDVELLIVPGDVEEMNRVFLNVMTEVELTHPEHDTITVQPGKYETQHKGAGIKQMEYTPEQLRTVAD